MKRLSACLTVLALFLLASCSSTSAPTNTTQAATNQQMIAPTPTPTPDGYLQTDDTGVVWVHWIEANSQLSGTWSTAQLESGQIAYHDFGLTGIHNEQTGAISITITVLGISTVMSGTLKGGVLNLDLQQDGQTKHKTLNAASNADYQKALNAFKAQHPGS